MKLGVDFNIYDEEGNLLLFFLVINGDGEMMDIFLFFGKYWLLFIFVYVDIIIRKKFYCIFWWFEEKIGFVIVVICF